MALLNSDFSEGMGWGQERVTGRAWKCAETHTRPGAGHEKLYETGWGYA